MSYEQPQLSELYLHSFYPCRDQFPSYEEICNDLRLHGKQFLIKLYPEGSHQSFLGIFEELKRISLFHEINQEVRSAVHNLAEHLVTSFGDHILTVVYLVIRYFTCLFEESTSLYELFDGIGTYSFALIDPSQPIPLSTAVSPPTQRSPYPTPFAMLQSLNIYPKYEQTYFLSKDLQLSCLQIYNSAARKQQINYRNGLIVYFFGGKLAMNHIYLILRYFTELDQLANALIHDWQSIDQYKQLQIHLDKEFHVALPGTTAFMSAAELARRSPLADRQALLSTISRRTQVDDQELLQLQIHKNIAEFQKNQALENVVVDLTGLAQEGKFHTFTRTVISEFEDANSEFNSDLLCAVPSNQPNLILPTTTTSLPHNAISSHNPNIEFLFNAVTSLQRQLRMTANLMFSLQSVSHSLTSTVHDLQTAVNIHDQIDDVSKESELNVQETKESELILQEHKEQYPTVQTSSSLQPASITTEVTEDAAHSVSSTSTHQPVIEEQKEEVAVLETISSMFQSPIANIVHSNANVSDFSSMTIPSIATINLPEQKQETKEESKQSPKRKQSSSSSSANTTKRSKK